MDPRFVLVVSDPDPVAPRVAAEWGSLPATGDHVEGAALRDLGNGSLVLRRSRLHVHDELLDQLLPPAVQEARPTLVFPSIHRSRENVVCFTVHPLGNLGASADVGGRPQTVNPTDPQGMVHALRRMAELAAPMGTEVAFESTHHGPELGLPSFFAEIGYGTEGSPPESMVTLLAAGLRELDREPEDRVAVAIGGGHYAPHFTDLALRRQWAFGHIVSRHALQSLDLPTARAAYRATPGAEGIVLARASDADHPALQGLGPRLRDHEAGPRGRGEAAAPVTDASRPSGT